ncbi:MAG: hypothetical protein AB7I38_17375 [Dehalococcoidia bacterium]|nr:hypothetical protein [Gemmatimonadota bacterium]
MVRDLAGWDPDRLPVVLRWPLREGLLAYLAQLRSEAARDYRLRLTVWAVLAPHQGRKGPKPPQPPPILRG